MELLNFNLIVAIASNRGIGWQGGLPWHVPEDLKHFREITCKTTIPGKKNIVIMGRKTWESLPERFRPLPQRINLIITRQEEFKVPEGVLVVPSLNEALISISHPALSAKIEQVFVIGGAQVFTEAIQLPQCQKIYVTKLLNSFPCDTYFPPFEDKFTLQSETTKQRSGNVEFFFCEYLRK